MLTCVVYGEDSLRVNSARSDLIKLFNPHDGISSADIEEFKASIASARTTVGETTTNQFLRRFKKVLKEHPKTKERLCRVVSDADVLATEFAGQKSYLRCYGIQDLPETFSSDSNLMKVYPMSGEPEDLDGKRVLLVVQPAIIAKGRASGHDYNLPPRVIKKAVVWLG